MSIAPREDRSGLGLGLMALAVCLFTCIDTSAKFLIQSGQPALQVVWCRYAGHFLLTLLVFYPQDRGDLFRTSAPVKQGARALFLFGSTLLNFLALTWLPITVTTTIMFAGPIAVTLLAIPFLGEKAPIVSQRTDRMDVLELLFLDSLDLLERPGWCLGFVELRARSGFVRPIADRGRALLRDEHSLVVDVRGVAA